MCNVCSWRSGPSAGVNIVSNALPFPVYSLQSYQDVEDEETLQAVEAAVRESTSVKRIMLYYERLQWTNVATALLRGATENKSLRLLTLSTPFSSPPPQDVVDKVRQKRRTLVFGINVIPW